MKVFKCGKCSTQYKIDDNQIKSSVIIVKCNTCGSKNILRFGAVLISSSVNGSKSFNLKLGENIIGRGDGNSGDISIDDKYVSRKHAILSLENRENQLYVSISDCNSTNGTFNKDKNKLKPMLKYHFKNDDYFIVGLTKLSIKFN
jgi:predicted Zn finger-like uncharacterized protein